MLILLIVGTALAKPQFLNLQNLRDVLLNVSIIGLLTAGMTVVILMRHIDLSVGVDGRHQRVCGRQSVRRVSAHAGARSRWSRASASGSSRAASTRC